MIPTRMAAHVYRAIRDGGVRGADEGASLLESEAGILAAFFGIEGVVAS